MTFLAQSNPLQPRNARQQPGVFRGMTETLCVHTRDSYQIRLFHRAGFRWRTTPIGVDDLEIEQDRRL